MIQNQQAVSGWETFALHNNLTFKPDNFLLMREAYVTGNYCGYNLTLESLTRKTYMELSRYSWGLGHLPGSTRIVTRMVLRSGRSNKTVQAKPVPSSQFDPKKTVNLLVPAEAQQAVRGRLFAYEKGREIVYEQENLETAPKYLQFVLGLLKNLIEMYPRVVELGGEVVPVLHPIASYYHTLQHVADQLIADIGQDTRKRLAIISSRLLCPHCFIHCGPHQVNVPWTGEVTYYGCRCCSQSRNLVTSDKYRLVAILDRDLAAEQVNHNDTIRINWIKYRKLFDFEEVEIVSATDEDVERFAVQIGNDTDPVRSSQYQKMRCVLSAKCGLSENTLRILRRTFGQLVNVDDAKPTIQGYQYNPENR